MLNNKVVIKIYAELNMQSTLNIDHKLICLSVHSDNHLHSLNWNVQVALISPASSA